MERSAPGLARRLPPGGRPAAGWDSDAGGVPGNDLIDATGSAATDVPRRAAMAVLRRHSSRARTRRGADPDSTLEPSRPGACARARYARFRPARADCRATVAGGA